MSQHHRTAIIVQARMGSTRLPGKVMREVAGLTLLGLCLRRCARTAGVDIIACATTDVAADDVIAREAVRHGAVVFRGSETDVLSRYLGAARAVDAEIVMRVTSDCPLIDPQICAGVLRLRDHENADYACNNDPPAYPHGLDCEAFTLASLVEADRAAVNPYDREHVTPWLRRAPTLRRVSLPGPGGREIERRWTLDFPEDLAFFTALIPKLDDPVEANFRQIADYLDRHPEIAARNASRRQR